ncbi:extracellular solute-binding protein [Paenibacillus sp. KS-LC4]|uniref:ABC transporter substrate-binding protein n=1 Tax=Paenibacillus sp. KS-LC4 TaxID=2979727 RepID=UPI0030CF130E
MKKSFKSAATLLLLSTVLAACGTNSGTGNTGNTGTAGNASPASTASSEKVKLTAWAWNVNVGALNEAVTSYQKDHPNVELEVQDIGRLDVYDKLSTGLAAGGAGLPDIVLVEDDRLQGYLDAFPKGFVNLSEKGFDAKLSEFPTFKQELTKKDGASYAFPFDAGPTGVFYRTDLFEKAGVDASKIETWDDYLAAGKLIKEKTGAQLFPADKFKDDATLRIMLNEQGAFYFDKDGNIDFNNPKYVKALETLKQFDDAGLIKDVNGWDGTVSATVDGSIASIAFGAWYTGTISDQAKDLSGKWGVMQVPAFEKGGNRAANLGGSSWALTSTSKNVDAAYSFMEYFSLTPDVQKVAMEKYGLFPSLTSVYNEDVFTTGVEFFSNQNIWMLFAQEMNAVPTPYYTKDYSVALDESVKAQSDVFNGKPAADALKEAAARLKDRTSREVNGG